MNEAVVYDLVVTHTKGELVYKDLPNLEEAIELKRKLEKSRDLVSPRFEIRERKVAL